MKSVSTNPINMHIRSYSFVCPKYEWMNRYAEKEVCLLSRCNQYIPHATYRKHNIEQSNQLVYLTNIQLFLSKLIFGRTSNVSTKQRDFTLSIYHKSYVSLRISMTEIKNNQIYNTWYYLQQCIFNTILSQIYNKNNWQYCKCYLYHSRCIITKYKKPDYVYTAKDRKSVV